MSELTNRAGVSATQLAVNKIGWFFREQSVSDQGVDAIVEDVDLIVRESLPDKEEGTGRLLALQIKAGPSQFAEKSPNGWWFRFGPDHARRWLNLAIPIAVVLVDTDTEACYWQEISPRTITEAGLSYKVEVPATQTVPTAAEKWRVLASKAAAEASTRYENSLDHLPPSVTKLVRRMASSSGVDAALLAYHLSEGRHNPDGTVSTFLAAEPQWVRRNAPTSWAAIGEYASNYDCNELAATAFEHAAQSSHEPENGESGGKWLANAALHLVDSDRHRAAALVDRAEADGAAPPVVAVLRAVLAHPEGDASPIDIPAGLDVDDETARRSPFVQSFLSIRAQRLGDAGAALRHARLALDADRDSSTLMMHCAEVLLWAAVSGHNDPTLPGDGIRLLQQAITQRRQWDGPLLEATLHLARACMLYGQLHVVLDNCLPVPDGTATEAVAADARVRRIAVTAAAALGRIALARKIAGLLADTHADQICKHRAGLLEGVC